MGLFRRRTGAPVLPLTEADRDAATALARATAVIDGRQTTPQGVLVLHLFIETSAARVVRALEAAGYEARRTDGQVVVTGVRPTPHAETVAAIDARVDELYALRADAQASNRLAEA